MVRAEKKDMSKKTHDVAWDVASILGSTMSMKYEELIASTFSAYVLSESNSNSMDELIKYISNKYSYEISLFIDEYNFDISALKEITNKHSKEDLKNVIIFFRNDYGSHKDNLETPISIIKLANRILNVKNKVIADFGCGYGNYIVDAVGDEPALIEGVDINTRFAAIASIRAKLLNAIIEIKNCDMLTMDDSRKYDCIFSNYPFGYSLKTAYISKETIDEICDGIPAMKKATSADWLYNINIVNRLTNDGKAVIITNNGTTWNGLDQGMRKYFVDNGFIEAVISLPSGMFLGTTISTTMMIFSHNNNSIRMIDATSIGEKGRRQHLFKDDDINRIYDLLSEDSDISTTVSIQEIKECDYYLNPIRYFETEMYAENGVEFGEVIKSISRGAQIKASDLDNMVSDDITDIQYLMLKNIQDGLIGELPYLKEIDKKLERYCIKNGSLIISKNGKPFKVAVANVPEGKKILANGNLYIIEIDEEKVDVYYLKAFFSSEQGGLLLDRLAVGAAMPNIPVESLKKALIPLPTLDEQRRIGTEYRIKEDEVSMLMYKLEKAKNELKNVFEEV